jgi:hypothetical protein
LVESENEKFEDLFKFMKKETVLFFAELFKHLYKFHKEGYVNDDFVRLLFD